MELIKKYFPNLTDEQYEQFEQLLPLYTEWNNKINVISRKDIDNLYARHVLHSLTIAKFITFKPGAKVLDLGTGGGFPGIPLAILFPETQFKLIDGTKKKITVVQEVAKALGLKNVVAQQQRAEEMKKERFDFVVSRAVAKLEVLVQYCKGKFLTEERHTYPNGLITLKGGNLKEEIKALEKGEYAERTSLQKLIPEPEFEDKALVYVQA